MINVEMAKVLWYYTPIILVIHHKNNGLCEVQNLVSTSL